MSIKSNQSEEIIITIINVIMTGIIISIILMINYMVTNQRPPCIVKHIYSKRKSSSPKYLTTNYNHQFTLKNPEHLNLEPTSLVDLDDIDNFINSKINQQWNSFEIEITNLNKNLEKIRNYRFRNNSTIISDNYIKQTDKHLNNIFQYTINILYIFKYNKKQQFIKLDLTIINYIENNLNTIKSNYIKSYSKFFMNNRYAYYNKNQFLKTKTIYFNFIYKNIKKVKDMYSSKK